MMRSWCVRWIGAGACVLFGVGSAVHASTTVPAVEMDAQYISGGPDGFAPNDNTVTLIYNDEEVAPSLRFQFLGPTGSVGFEWGPAFAVVTPSGIKLSPNFGEVPNGLTVQPTGGYGFLDGGVADLPASGPASSVEFLYFPPESGIVGLPSVSDFVDGFNEAVEFGGQPVQAFNLADENGDPFPPLVYQLTSARAITLNVGDVPPAVVPSPTAAALGLIGVAWLGLRRRRAGARG